MHKWRAAFSYGVVGGGACVSVELAARLVAGVPTLPELIQDRVIQAMPGPMLAFLLDRLLYLGKPLLFAALLLVQLILAGLIGLALTRWRQSAVVLSVLWILTGAALLPLAGQQPFGGSSSFAVALLLAFIAYGLVYEGLWRTSRAAWAPADGGLLSRTAARRDVLAGLVLLSASAVLARLTIISCYDVQRKVNSAGRRSSFGRPDCAQGDPHAASRKCRV